MALKGWLCLPLPRGQGCQSGLKTECVVVPGLKIGMLWFLKFNRWGHWFEGIILRILLFSYIKILLFLKSHHFLSVIFSYIIRYDNISWRPTPSKNLSTKRFASDNIKLFTVIVFSSRRQRPKQLRNYLRLRQRNQTRKTKRKILTTKEKWK